MDQTRGATNGGCLSEHFGKALQLYGVCNQIVVLSTALLTTAKRQSHMYQNIASVSSAPSPLPRLPFSY